MPPNCLVQAARGGLGQRPLHRCATARVVRGRPRQIGERPSGDLAWLPGQRPSRSVCGGCATRPRPITNTKDPTCSRGARLGPEVSRSWGRGRRRDHAIHGPCRAAAGAPARGRGGRAALPQAAHRRGGGPRGRRVTAHAAAGLRPRWRLVVPRRAGTRTAGCRRGAAGRAAARGGRGCAARGVRAGGGVRAGVPPPLRARARPLSLGRPCDAWRTRRRPGLVRPGPRARRVRQRGTRSARAVSWRRTAATGRGT